jgi:lipopolysaccharide export system permease protein
VFTELEGTTFLVEGVRAGAFSTVFLHESNADGGTTAVTARNGMLVRPGDQAAPVLRLFDGVRLTVQEDDGGTEKTAGQDAPRVGVLRFQELRMTLGEGQAPIFRPRGADEREYTLTELWQRRFEPPPGVRRSDMVAEFHSRVTRVLSVLFLPLLGIPLALGRRRSDRSYGLALGLLVLIVYNQVLDLGKNIAETGAISPLLGLWLPLLAFASASTWLFHRASSRVPTSGGYAFPSLPAPLVRSVDRTRTWIGRQR